MTIDQKPQDRSVDDADEAYEIGKRDGYEEAVQDIDLLTGGDGEYRYRTDHDPDRHTPDAEAMKRRIVGRFSPPKEAEVTVTEEMVERAMGAFIEEVRRQDGEWTDDFDEERLLTSPSGDWFAPFFPIRAALVAALSRKG